MTLVISTQYNNIAIAISAYADAARADNALLIGTQLTGADARITDSGESYKGTLRWLSYTDAENVSNENSTEITPNTLALSNKSADYIKAARNTAAEEMSLQRLVSKQDGLSYLGGKFGAVQARAEDSQLRSALMGVTRVAHSTGTAVAYTIPTATAGAKVGNFGWHTGRATATTMKPLFTVVDSTNTRSSVFDNLLDAMAGLFADQEDSSYYLVTNSAEYNILRKNNVIDVAPIVDGNLSFDTMMGGKIRLYVTDSSKDPYNNVKVSFLMKAGAFHYSPIAQINPTAIERNEFAGNGSGMVSIFSRWGNIIHPMGYSYTATATGFVTNAQLALAANWSTVAVNVNETGIFPIVHG